MRAIEKDLMNELASTQKNKQVEIPKSESQKYSNKSFGIPSTPLILSGEYIDQLQTIAIKHTALLNKTLALFASNEDVKKFFNFTDEQLSLINTAYFHTSPTIGIARLDGYIERITNKYYILENNTDCPAGTLFTPRINNLVDRYSIKRSKTNTQLRLPLNGDNENTIVDIFNTLYEKESPNRPLRCIAILQPEGKASAETHELVSVLQKQGLQALIADPASLSWKDDYCTYMNFSIDMIWNKINTVYWDQDYTNNTELRQNLCRAIQNKKVIHINNFAARYITESKLCHAFLWEDSFSPLFTGEEKQFISMHIPKTFKVTKHEASYNNHIDRLKKNKDSYVIKHAYDIRGEGVTVGKSVTDDVWCEALSNTANEYIAQEYIESETINIDGIKRMSLDIYMNDLAPWSLGSKISSEFKVNVFQGGSKISVWERPKKNV